MKRPGHGEMLLSPSPPFWPCKKCQRLTQLRIVSMSSKTSKCIHGFLNYKCKIHQHFWSLVSHFGRINDTHLEVSWPLGDPKNQGQCRKTYFDIDQNPTLYQHQNPALFTSKIKPLIYIDIFWNTRNAEVLVMTFLAVNIPFRVKARNSFSHLLHQFCGSKPVQSTEKNQIRQANDNLKLQSHLWVPWHPMAESTIS